MRASTLVAAAVIALGIYGCAAGTVSTSAGGDKLTAISITTQPANQTVSVGQVAIFTVGASAGTPLTYQWQKNGANIAGASAASYTTPPVAATDSGAMFTVVVSNGMSGVTSNPAKLTVNAANTPPTITSQPTSQTIVAGQTATFSVVASGTAPLTYQWQKAGANIPNATGASYTTTITAVTDSGAIFDVVVSNSAGSVTSGNATLTVNAASTAPAISTQPTNQTVAVMQTATFTVVASGTAPLTYQWQKNAVNIPGATSASYTTPATATTDNGEQFQVTVTNAQGSVASAPATLTVNTGTTTSSAIDVVTYHYDNFRTGQNINETTLSPGNVNSTKFGKLGEFTVDGHVDAQPLLLSSLNIPGKGAKNVLYVVTEHDSIYAFDSDSNGASGGTVLWKSTTLLAGETTSDNRGCGQVSPEIGITSTPVIDRSRNAIYVVAMSKDANGNYFQRLHALDLTTGAELFGGPTTIQATYPGTGDNSSNGSVVFDPKQYKERAGLLQIGGTIYTTWASHCDIRPYTGWIIAYSADTLTQSSVLNIVPNGSEGAIWMSGGAPGADASGNIYFIDANGDFDPTLNSTTGLPVNGNCGNCFAKISSTVPMTLLDYFTPLNTAAESDSDADFGSGGELLIPDVVDANGNTRHLAVGSGKDSIIYVVDRDNMGKFHPSSDGIYQQINGQLAGGVFSKPSYFNGTVYYGAVSDHIKAFPIVNGLLATAPASVSLHTFGFPGATPAISASGTTNGIVWVVENSSPAVLHAYDATNLATELYNSNQAANARDQFSSNKFITPIIANGKVYVGTASSVAVFGLMP